ncbi:MAG: ATP-dependent DNA helicase RecG [Chloroflexi bacterium]|nr:ATP-dependent DNA helicase RecG [Chloroflexota bacterium]
MPNSATEKLTKILKLEAERGYQDKAVTRGLASFANAWLADAAKSNIDAAWAMSIADEMRTYSAAPDVATRRTALSALIQRLQTPTLAGGTAKGPAGASPSGRESAAQHPPYKPERARPAQRAAPQFANRPPASKRPQNTDTDQQATSAALINHPPAPVTPAAADQAATAEPGATTASAEPASVGQASAGVAPTPAQARAPARSQTQPRLSPSPRQLEQLQPRRSTRTPPRQYSGLGLDAPVSTMSGFGDSTAERLAKLGVKTIRDLLYFFPTRYDDYSALKTINQLEYGESVTIIGRVASAWKQRTKSGLLIVRIALEDASGMIECSWFSNEYGAENLLKQLQVGRETVISGKVTEYLGKLIFQNPSQEPAEKEWVIGGSIVPVYRLTEGLQPLRLRRAMKRLIEYWPEKLDEFLPNDVRQNTGLMPINEAIRQIHWPRDLEAQEQARRRLAFDELFVLQMAVLKQRRDWRSEPAQPLPFEDGLLDALKATLPYTLTGAQDRAIRAIVDDLRKPTAMHRLLQGDVGSGKTVIAALGMVLAASAGAQSALMAPTEILAEQHFNNLSKLFDVMREKGAIAPLQVRLLTGSVKASEKREVYDALADGSVHIVIGTHALIQDGVSFKNLGLVVVDEQHRFGVAQRKALRDKGHASNPHTLVMTATPIPRTLALTLYGDLDNTVLDEMPPGRQPIETHWFAPAERERAYSFVRQQVEQGRQAFIICPLVEESEKIEAKAAVEEHTRLQREVFPKLRLGLLHGRMKADEKDDVMSQFGRGELDILVSTSVVEVGIDVANATVMMIEGANRFGLSQLHQFRGRVGRGMHRSYCLLIADTSAAVSDERLMAIVSTQDGFKLAEKDLEIRGPGEFFGVRQSGEPELKLVNLRDRDLLLVAREQAEMVFSRDLELSTPEYRPLADKVATFWAAHENHGDAS